MPIFTAAFVAVAVGVAESSFFAVAGAAALNPAVGGSYSVFDASDLET